MLKGQWSKHTSAHQIIPYFPDEIKIWIEPFCRTCSMFFAFYRSNHSDVLEYKYFNDIDSNIVNFWEVFMHQNNELKEAIEMLPISNEIYQYLKKEDFKNKVEQAIALLLWCNFSYFGKKGSLKLLHSVTNQKEKIKDSWLFYKLLTKKAIFLNEDFEVFLNKVTPKHDNKHIPKKHRFIYADPLYEDLVLLRRLIDVCISTEIKFAISQADNQEVRKIVNSYGDILNIKEIGNVDTKTKRKEILIINYKKKVKRYFEPFLF